MGLSKDMWIDALKDIVDMDAGFQPQRRKLSTIYV